jgi:transcription antitermination protein NusB
MGIRRKSRELAMQALFFMDTRGPSKERLQLFCRCQPPSKTTYSFFITLVEGVLVNLTHLDRSIEQYSSNWKISRMSCVDRNILRIGVFEMLFCDDIPHKVTINEAIDIGKKYGTDESGAFINGILDSVRLAFGKGDIQPVVAHGNPNEIWDSFDTTAAQSASGEPANAGRLSQSVKSAPARVSKHLSPTLRKRYATRETLPSKQGESDEF